MKPLICPKCSGKLDSVIYNDIEVDRCHQCQGIWFDETEADELKEIKGSEIIDLEESPPISEHDDLEQVVRCPRCQVKMIKLLDMDKYQIWYEQCPQCHGIWLDAGEFHQFKENFLPQGWLQTVREIFYET